MASDRSGGCEDRLVTPRSDIIGFLDELLDASAFDDYGPNGLQVPGAAEVETVVTGVSANAELIERSIAAGADLLLVHHGLFWRKAPLALSEAMANRLRLLLGADVSLAAYHLPLDAHPEVGNNALLCRGLGLEPSGTFAAAGGRDIGMVATAAQPLSPADLAARVSDLLDRDPLVLAGGPDQIRSVGIISGGGAGFLAEAAERGLDALITGEPSEPAGAEARESRIHLLAAGHHATERGGIRRLGDLVAERFGVRHEFIDVPNPV